MGLSECQNFLLIAKKEPYKMGETQNKWVLPLSAHIVIYYKTNNHFIYFSFFFFSFSFLLCFLSWFLRFQVSIPLFLQTKEIDSRPRLRPGQLHNPAISSGVYQSRYFFSGFVQQEHILVFWVRSHYQALVLHTQIMDGVIHTKCIPKKKMR
jgi:hypothetical protein